MLINLPKLGPVNFSDSLTPEQFHSQLQDLATKYDFDIPVSDETHSLWNAAKSGVKEFGGSAEQAFGHIFNLPGVEESGKKLVSDSQQEYQPYSDKELASLEKQGLGSWLGAEAKNVAGETLQGLGRYAVPTIAGGIGSLAAGPIGGVAAFGATDFAANLGENINYQQQANPNQDVNTGQAAAAALGQTVLDRVGIPFLHVLPKSIREKFGTDVAGLASKIESGDIKPEDAINQLGSKFGPYLKSVASNYTGLVGMGVGDEALRRAQAGQNVTSPDALQAYKDQLVGAAAPAALFGGIGGYFGARNLERNRDLLRNVAVPDLQDQTAAAPPPPALQDQTAAAPPPPPQTNVTPPIRPGEGPTQLNIPFTPEDVSGVAGAQRAYDQQLVADRIKQEMLQKQQPAPLTPEPIKGTQGQLDLGTPPTQGELDFNAPAAPTTAPVNTVLTPDALKATGLKPQSAFFKQLVNKDLANPDHVQDVADILANVRQNDRLAQSTKDSVHQLAGQLFNAAATQGEMFGPRGGVLKGAESGKLRAKPDTGTSGDGVQISSGAEPSGTTTTTGEPTTGGLGSIAEPTTQLGAGETTEPSTLTKPTTPPTEPLKSQAEVVEDHKQNLSDLQSNANDLLNNRLGDALETVGDERPEPTDLSDTPEAKQLHLASLLNDYITREANRGYLDENTLNAQQAETEKAILSHGDNGQMALDFVKENPQLARTAIREMQQDALRSFDSRVISPEVGGRAPVKKTEIKFSETQPGTVETNTSNADEVNKVINDVFQSPERANKKIVVHATEADARRAVPEAFEGKTPGAVRAFTKDGKVHMIAENIPKGRELGVLMHELGVHEGMEKMVGKENMNWLTDRIDEWAKRKDNSLEARIARRAIERARHANPEHAQEEKLAYFVEEAINEGVNPTGLNKGPVGNWFRRMVAGLKTALRKLGFKSEKLNAQHIVDLAHGAAHLDLEGNFHGTAADFRKFKQEYMGSGEGAQAFGWGHYFAERRGIARDYRKADVERKTSTSNTFEVAPKGFSLFKPTRFSEKAREFIDLFEGYYLIELKKGIDDPINLLYKLHAEYQKDINSDKEILEHLAAPPKSDKYWSNDYLAMHDQLSGLVGYYHTFGERKGKSLRDFLIDRKKSDLEFRTGYLQGADEIIKAYKRGNLRVNKASSHPKGSLMRVVHDVRPHEWLDLDKPLSEQSEYVQQRLKHLEEIADKANNSPLIDNLWHEDMSGRDIYNLIQSLHVADALPAIPEEYERHVSNDEYASKYLNSLGIKGNKFLDQPSREIQKNIKQLEEMKQVEEEDKTIRPTANGEMSQKARQRLIDSLTQEINELKNKLKHNYVVFDDKNIHRIATNLGEKESEIKFSEAHPVDDLNSSDPERISQGFSKVGDAVNSLPAFVGDKVEGLKNAISNVQNGGLKRTFFKTQRLEMLNHMYPDFGVKETGTKLLKSLQDLLSGRQGAIDNHITEADKIFTRARQIAKVNPNAMKTLDKLAIDARLAEVDLLNPKESEGAWNDRRKKAQIVDESTYQDYSNEYDRLSKIWNNKSLLPDYVKRSYTEMRAYYDKVLTDFQNSLFGDDGALTPGAKAKLLGQFEAMRNGVKGYIPLMRFGDWVVKYINPETGEPMASQFESFRERQRFVDTQLKGVEGVQLLKRVQDLKYSPSEVPPTSFIGKIITDLAQNGAPPEVLDSVYQNYLLTFPVGSIKKRFLHAKRVGGVDPLGKGDYLVKTFGQVAPQWGRRIANSIYAPKLANVFAQVKHVGETTSDPTTSDLAQHVLGQAKFQYDPTYGPWVHNATAMSYFEYIAGNISSAFVHFMHVPLTVLPTLGAEHTYGGASKALSNAFKVVNKGLENNPKYAVLYQMLKDRAQIDHTTQREILQNRNAPLDTLHGVFGNVSNLLSLPFAVSEKYTRRLTAVAAYDLAREKGMSPEAAADYATDIVMRTQTSGIAAMAPTIMQHPFGRMFLTFKNFVWNTSSMFARAVYESIKHEDPETQRIARRQAVGMLFMATALAGAKGLPFYGAAETTANMINALLGDGSPYDFNEEMKKHFGELFSKGPFNYFLNADLADRIGYGQDILFRDDPRMISQDGYVLWAMRNMFGPLGSYAANAEQAISEFNQGHIERGIEGLLPNFMRNAMKGYRYVTQGATTIDGIPIQQDIGAYNGLMQAIGFAPADVASKMETKAAVDLYQKQVERDRTNIVRLYVMGATTGDDSAVEMAMSRMDKFNDAHPDYALNGGVLSKALKAHNKALNDSINGIQFNKHLINEVNDKFNVE